MRNSGKIDDRCTVHLSVVRTFFHILHNIICKDYLYIWMLFKGYICVFPLCLSYGKRLNCIFLQCAHKAFWISKTHTCMIGMRFRRHIATFWQLKLDETTKTQKNNSVFILMEHHYTNETMDMFDWCANWHCVFSQYFPSIQTRLKIYSLPGMLIDVIYEIYILYKYNIVDAYPS